MAVLGRAQGARLVFVLVLAQLLVPVQLAGAVGAPAPAFTAPLQARPMARRPAASVCRCAGKSVVAAREEQEQYQAEDTCVFQAVEQSSWVMGTGVSSEKEPDNESAEHDVLLLAVSDKFQRQTTLGYLTWMKEDMEMQQSRQRRDDDFGETDDEVGGVRAHGYEKKSKKKSFDILRSAESLGGASERGGKTIEKTLEQVPLWQKLFGRKAKDKMRDQHWLQGLE